MNLIECAPLTIPLLDSYLCSSCQERQVNLIKYAPLTVPLIPLLRLPERQVNLIEYAPLMKINWLVGRDADRAQQVGVILFVAPSDRIQGAILLPFLIRYRVRFCCPFLIGYRVRFCCPFLIRNGRRDSYCCPFRSEMVGVIHFVAPLIRNGRCDSLPPLIRNVRCCPF